MPLAQITTGAVARQMRAPRSRTACAGQTSSSASQAAERVEIGRRLDAGIERDARQVDRIGAIVRDRRGDRRIARPQGDPPAGAARQAGERRAPGAAADHADMAMSVNGAHRLRLKAMEMRSAPPR